MQFVVGVDSVHTAAAACDYLADRVAADDAVAVVAVREDGSRDAADAANVARVRLSAGDVSVETRDGDPGEEILAVASEAGADEVVVGTHAGAPGSGPGVGETTRFLLRAVDVPVVVVPVPELDPA